MRILFTGGGTAGSVMPLLALHDTIKHKESAPEFLFVGTRSGQPERALAQSRDISYQGIFAGKLRRYFDIRNISDVFVTIVGFFQSLVIVARFKPDVVVGAGGFVSVPVIWAAWVHRKKILIHQQDVRPSLSNILTMNLANKITVSFEGSLRHFPASKAVWTGNPTRRDLFSGSLEDARTQFGLHSEKPTVLVTGGGTGAVTLNNAIQQALPKLVDCCQVIHITGRGKQVEGIDHPDYHQYEFIDEGMVGALTVADVIVSRAGLSSLSEYAALGKAVILVPLPHSHQEVNADYVQEKNAAIVFREKDVSPNRLVDKIVALLEDRGAMHELQSHIKRLMKKGATDTITTYIKELSIK